MVLSPSGQQRAYLFKSNLRVACALLVGAAALPGAELHVAAASNLGPALKELSAAFEKSGVARLVVTPGATAQLEQQIENGAPFSVFLAADTEHVDQLIARGKAVADSRAVYARGRLAIWAPGHPEINRIEEVAAPQIKVIVVAKPELAPYGAAAVEAMREAGIWGRVQSRVVYAPSVALVKQMVDTGNGDVAFTALSLVTGQQGHSVPVSARLHKPINQALCIIKGSGEDSAARAFVAFLRSPEAQAILKQAGYE